MRTSTPTKARDDRQRQGEGDKQGHAMMGVELVDNHDSIYIAEGDETQREDAAYCSE